MADFIQTLNDFALSDLDFANDDFETALRKNHTAIVEQGINAYKLKLKAAELVVFEQVAQAVIKFARLNKDSYRLLEDDKKAELKSAFADLEAQLDWRCKRILDAGATSADLVEVGNDLLETTPDEG